jgi:RHS repeat-associated protein
MRMPTYSNTNTKPTSDWHYSPSKIAQWIGKEPGGDKLELYWDSLGLLKGVSDNVGSSSTTHQFTYAPSGLRIRDKRSTAIAGSMPHDKRFAYTTAGTLLSVWEVATSSQPHGDLGAMASRPRKTDIVYANGEAVIEIVTRPPAAQGDPPSDPHYILIPPPPPENIYELHNDYLGSPRYITHGSKPPSLLPRGEMAGEQAFGPYGERMEGNFVVGGTPDDPILKGLPSGYKPITGYTGHVAEDMTGLIYMRGRYYSPAWHRFVNSDQGVDPLSINQFAYVNGSPFMARDPYGMETCVIFLTIFLGLIRK